MMPRTIAASAAAALVLALAPSVPASAGDATPTLTGSWGTGCSTITVDSTGQPEGATIHVRWYGSDHATIGEQLVPANAPWSLKVDPAGVRGFSYRLADASGNWLTPLRDEAAACVVVTKPAASLSAVDCDTVHASAVKLPLNASARGQVRVLDETGAVAASRTDVSSLEEDIDLPTGHTYRVEAGFVWSPDGTWHVSARSEALDLTAACPTPTPEPTETTTPTPEPSTSTTSPAPTETTTPTPEPPTTTTAPQPPVSTPEPTPTTSVPTSNPATPEPAPTTSNPTTSAPTITPKPTMPGTPKPTKPAKPTPRRWSRTVQVDHYRWASARERRAIAAYAADGTLRYREDRSQWSDNCWAIARQDLLGGRVVATKVLRSGGNGCHMPGPRRVMTWTLAKGATPNAPWGPRHNLPQAVTR